MVKKHGYYCNQGEPTARANVLYNAPSICGFCDTVKADLVEEKSDGQAFQVTRNE